VAVAACPHILPEAEQTSRQRVTATWRFMNFPLDVSPDRNHYTDRCRNMWDKLLFRRAHGQPVPRARRWPSIWAAFQVIRSKRYIPRRFDRIGASRHTRGGIFIWQRSPGG